MATVSHRTTHTARGWILAAALSPIASRAQPLVESILQVPVALHDADGGELRQSMVVSVVREDATGRRPFLVLLHGRPPDVRGRVAVGLQTYPANARYFASRGFVVFTPTRVGYGVTHGPDVEYTGECDHKRFSAGVVPAVTETEDLLTYAARLPYVDPKRGVIVGESFGGLVAVAVASSAIPGITGAVNIAGGDGGDSLLHVDRPCSPDQLRDTFASFGGSAKVPTLWMYSANDRVWGKDLPGQWFRAYAAAGGRGEFVALPADKNNGHYIFNRNAPAWHPAFEAFISTLGLGTTR